MKAEISFKQISLNENINEEAQRETTQSQLLRLTKLLDV